MLTWAIQTHLSDAVTLKMVEACKANGNPVIEVEDLQKISDVPSDVPTVFYGSLGLTLPAYQLKKWYPGVILNKLFDMEVWTKRWGENCLNHDASFHTVEEYYNGPATDCNFFIRPTLDDKRFTGAVMSFQDFADWAFSLSMIAPEAMKSKIAVCAPKVVTEEWRVFVVDGKVSTGSQYQKNGKSLQLPLSPDVIEYTTRLATLWSPAHIFTLDIGRHKDCLYVIEAGCFNSAGIYGSDSEKLVRDINVLGNSNKSW